MKAKSYLLLAASVFSLLSCAKEEQTQEITPEMSAPICVIAEAAGVEADKTHIDDYPGTGPGGNWDLSKTGTAFDVFWDEKGEQVSLSIYTLEKEHKYTLGSKQDYTLLKDGKKATFSFNRPDEKDLPSGKYLFVSISPYSSVRTNNVVFLPNEQNVVKRNIKPKYATTSVNTCYYDPKSALLVSRCQQAELGAKPIQLNMEYEKASALNCLTMKNMPTGVYKVDVEFSHGDTAQYIYIAGGRYFNLFTSTPGSFVTDPTGANLPQAKTKITLFCKDENGKADYFEAQPDVWFNSWGVVLQEGDKINVTAYAVNATYTADLTVGSGRSLYLEEGSMNHFTIDFNEGRTGITKEIVAPDIELLDNTQTNGKIYWGTQTLHSAPVEHTTVVGKSDLTFLPDFDKVRIRVQESQYEIEVLPESFYKVTPSEIHLKGLPASRLGQHIQLYLYRGSSEVVNDKGLITKYNSTEYYPLFSNYTAPTSSGFDKNNWIQMVDPETENPKRFCIVDQNLMEQLKKGISESAGGGLQASFDIYGGVTGCKGYDHIFSLAGGTFKTFRNMAAFNVCKDDNGHPITGSLSDERTLDKKGALILKHDPQMRIWNNPNLIPDSGDKVVLDLSAWNAAVNPYNYYNSGSSISPSPINELYLGPNMTGYRWMVRDNDEDNVLEILDCSKSSEVHYIIHHGRCTNLKLLDLRVKGKKDASEKDYTRLCNKSYCDLSCFSAGINLSLPSPEDLKDLTIRINKDVYDKSREYNGAQYSETEKKQRLFAYRIAVYLKYASFRKAKIEVWNGGAKLKNFSNMVDDNWIIVTDGNIDYNVIAYPSDDTGWNNWPLLHTPKKTCEDENWNTN